jgi:hypothetical protein
MDELETGPLYLFSEWPNAEVPTRSAGVYTIWRGDEFLYVGMSGRGAQAEDFVVTPAATKKAKGLYTRLNSHALGRRSGDQFNIYVCDRFVVPKLTPQDQEAIGSARLSLDQMTKAFIHNHLGYRFMGCRDGAEAFGVEQSVRAGWLKAGKPYLNPL